MNEVPMNGQNFLRLLRFLVWYAVALVALFFFLPMLGEWLQSLYESLDGQLRIILVSGFFAGVGIWQLLSLKRSAENEWHDQ